MEGTVGSPVPHYLRGMRLKTGMFATWLPNESIAVGDIGIVTDDYFQRISSLAQQGVDFTLRQGARAEDFSQLDSASVNVQLKASATADPTMAVPVGKAGVAFEFNGKRAFAFRASGCTTDSIDDIAIVETQIVCKFKVGEWDKAWHVVTTAVRAERTTILVAHNSGTKLELSTDNELTAWTDLNAGVKSEVVRETGAVTSFIGQEAMTPLFRLFHIRSGPIRGARLLPKGVAQINLITPKMASSDPEVANALHFEEARPLDDDE
jgi:hypothetical protein